jgi:predicted nucleotidyltransferase
LKLNASTEAAVDGELGSLHNHNGDDWPPPIDAASGQDVLDDAVRVSLESMGGRLLAAYALGSLAHGGFSPLVSDVDMALILADPILSSDHESLLLVAEKVRSRGTPLHTRVSIFWGTPASLTGRTVGGRFPPLDRLCLLEHGLLLSGNDVRHGLPRPDRTDLLVTGAQFALDALAADVVAHAHRPDLLVTAGVRWTTKIILFPVRFLFTAETGREGTNEAAAQHHLARAQAPGAALVAAALGWRTNPPALKHAITMLRDGLRPLYGYYLGDHIQRLESHGQPELAQAFRDWRACLLTT